MRSFRRMTSYRNFEITMLNSNIYFLFFIISFGYFVRSETSLKQIHMLFRHGERAPTETYPKDPYIDFKWSGGWGQLSNRGKLQMYTLGQEMKAKYEHFIPDIYWFKDINITSSYSDRCRMSGQLFCAGMFPPIGEQIWNNDLLWQPIPISYLPRSEDITIAMKAPCDKYDEIFKQIRVSPEILELEKKHKNLMVYLTEHTGENVTNIEHVENIYNTLEIEKLQNLTLPSWVNQTLMDTMKILAARNLALYSETQYMQRVKGGVLVKDVINSMERILDGKEEPRLYLYSGHDITLVHILRTLQLVGTTLKPGFGASLVFELYLDGEVKIIYRDSWDSNPEIMDAYQCPSPCYLWNFKKSLEAVLPLNWDKECELDSTS